MAGDAQGTGQVYKLRSVLQGHSMDVKQVSVVSEPSGALLTASRDKTARLLKLVVKPIFPLLKCR